MKKFVKNISLIVTAVLLWILFIGFFNHQYWNIKDFSINESINTLYFGNSMLRDGYEALPHELNLAHEGEALEISIVKAKTFIDHNPQVKTVYLQVSPVQLRYWISTERSSVKHFNYDINWMFLSQNHYWGRKDEALLAYVQHSSIFPMMNYQPIWGPQVDIKDGAIPENFNIPRQLKFLVNKDAHKLEINYRFKDHIKDLITFCNEKQVELNFISVPIFSEIMYSISEENNNFFNEIIKETEKDHYWLNAWDSTLTREYFYDAMHMNLNGRKWFTNWINENRDGKK